jgi:predicted nucleotidyltransferase
MNDAAVYKAIRQTVQANLPGSRILLFGSRARGDGDSKSDYDLLIITPLTFTAKEKIDLSTLLDHALVSTVNIPVDLLINSEEEVQQKQGLPGHIVRSAIKEGFFL